MKLFNNSQNLVRFHFLHENFLQLALAMDAHTVSCTEKARRPNLKKVFLAAETIKRIAWPLTKEINVS